MHELGYLILGLLVYIQFLPSNIYRVPKVNSNIGSLLCISQRPHVSPPSKTE
jgi:hypothetical protein